MPLKASSGIKNSHDVPLEAGSGMKNTIMPFKGAVSLKVEWKSFDHANSRKGRGMPKGLALVIRPQQPSGPPSHPTRLSPALVVGWV